MTRQDFIDGITTWSDLLDFCYNEDCDICEGIVSNDTMCEEIDDDLREATQYRSWQDVRDLLNDIDTDYDYYRRESSLEYVPMDDDDFDSYKEDVIEWMDNGGYWEDDEEDEEYDEPFQYDGDFTLENAEYDEDKEPPTEDEDFSVGELMGMCSVQYLGMQREAAQRMKQSDEEFEQYLSNMPKVLQ